jgi:hypothetical protein
MERKDEKYDRLLERAKKLAPPAVAGVSMSDRGHCRTGRTPD